MGHVSLLLKTILSWEKRGKFSPVLDASDSYMRRIPVSLCFIFKTRHLKRKGPEFLSSIPLFMKQGVRAHFLLLK